MKYFKYSICHSSLSPAESAVSHFFTCSPHCEVIERDTMLPVCLRNIQDQWTLGSLRVKCGVVVYCSAGPFRRGIPQLSLDFLYVTHFRSVFLKITSSRESTTDCSDIFIQKEQFFLMHMNKWHAGECKKTIKIKSSGQGRITNWDTRPQTALKCTILAHSVVVGWFSTNQEG